MPLAAIFGCSGPNLLPDERAFFRDIDPLGFILFTRNCHSREQIRALVGDLKAAVGRDDAPILIDQEGGRVARLRPPLWPAYPPAGRIGALALRDPRRGEDATRAAARLIAEDLREVGVNVDCAPVLDVLFPEGHGIIGDRAFGANIGLVARLGRAFCEGLLDGNVLPVVKHMPGHGRARADSHAELPVVDTAEADLAAVDFAPFRALADAPWAMTAHVLYTSIDAHNPATTSSRLIGGIIRGNIGFDGFLVSDDLCMRALAGGMSQRTEAALAAGCDAVLHCDGNLPAMMKVAAAARALDSGAESRFARAEARRHAPRPIDRKSLAAWLDALLEPA